MPPFGTKQISKAKSGAQKAAKQAKKTVAKKAPPKPKVPSGSQATKRVSNAASKAGSALKKVGSAGQRMGGAGYRRYEGDALWLPNTQRPPWLDGSLPGDRGFDPLGLSKPAEYLQFEVDEQDQNAGVNRAGGVVGSFKSGSKNMVNPSATLAPYNEVFGLDRFRECELIHGRWAMLACLGCLWAELQTGVSWVEAGKVELDGAQYANQSLPFTIGQLCWIEAILVGGAELYRNSETDPAKRCYPGGYFDPLGFASGKGADRLKEAEIKHCRLAMVAFLGYGVQALAFGEGVLGSLAVFSKSFN